MKIDLFSTTIFDYLKCDFGIHDENKLPTEPAKIVHYNDGIAKVINRDKYSIYFIPLDKNIECLRADGNIESQCDALLICLRPQNKYDFYFVELKDSRTGDWIQGGIEQLKATIETFRSNYNLSYLSKKMSFLANKKKPHYPYSHIEFMERFRNETGFRLSICATIAVK